MNAGFATELKNWGPGALSGRGSPSRSEAAAYCRRLAQTHYENFPVVTWLLPRALVQHFCNVYAYCRWSDDLADEVHGSQESLALLAWWRQQLHDCYDGRARHPVFVALGETIAEFTIPPGPFLDLISAFEQDQRVHSYDTFNDLLGYCRRSANPVGRLVLYVCRAFHEQHAAWSDSICTGLQLANFWQDVARDFDIGRVYLPREDRERFGYCDDDLQARTTNSTFQELMRFQVDRARDYLQAGLPLVERMPGRLQVVVDLFAQGGLRILERVEAIGYRVWNVRPVLTRSDAVRLMIASIGRWAGRGCRRCVCGRGQSGSQTSSIRRKVDDDFAR